MNYARKNSLWVSEQFTSIQGEGQTIGMPAHFIRLKACNLDCVWCDTTEVWKQGIRKTFEQVAEDIGEKNLQLIREQNMHLIITGGEPLLQQDSIVRFINWFSEEIIQNFDWQLEIETNGTIIPARDMIREVNYWNVSPKLLNAGYDWHDFGKLVNEDALIEISMNGKNPIFKFVVVGWNDVNQIERNYIPPLEHFNIQLMPMASSQKEMAERADYVAEMAIKRSFRYSPRLQIDLWNTKTGK